MNAPHPYQLSIPQQGLPQPVVTAQEEGSEIPLAEYWDIVVDSRWLIALITFVFLLLGASYAILSNPVYEANLLIQVEDSESSAKSFLGEAASLFDVKTPAAAEIEIIRSRFILGQAVDNTRLYIDAKPRYLPVVGSWLARHSDGLSDPGFLGLSGYVTGRERIELQQFDVPASMEGKSFVLTALGGGRFSLAQDGLDKPLLGTVGTPLVRQLGSGTITLNVTTLAAKPGAEFSLTRQSRLSTIEDLQEKLKLVEKGRQTGVIDARMQSSDAPRLASLLNEIGKQYVRQNIERKAAEAQKTLTFLDTQLPQFKRQLNLAEEAYNKYRNQQGTIALDEEARIILNRSVDLQSKLLEAQQKRLELVSRFTAEHPSVQTLDQQIRGWTGELAALNSRIKGLPAVQQDALRLERDVKVNNDLYQQLRNNALQLQLVREGKVGNVRLIDPALVPEEPVKPKKLIVIALALMLGFATAVLLAVTRNAFFRGIRNSHEIEAHTGLNVYSTIPLSTAQAELARKVAERHPGLHLLAALQPQDPAIESLRSLRTALQFAMLDAPNNRVLITGATPGVGKSFVSANFAAVLAMSGKRVLLIDADLRKGYINSYFGLPRAPGLSEAVAGMQEASGSVVRKVMDNLDVVTTGVLPPNPAELMGSSSFTAFVDRMSAQYDVLIIDTAPVLAAADALAIASKAGTLLLVARAEVTQLGELNESAKRLAHAGKTATGIVFNALNLNRRHYGSYGYKYGGYRYQQYSYEPPAP